MNSDIKSIWSGVAVLALVVYAGAAFAQLPGGLRPAPGTAVNAGSHQAHHLAPPGAGGPPGMAVMDGIRLPTATVSRCAATSTGPAQL